MGRSADIPRLGDRPTDGNPRAGRDPDDLDDSGCPILHVDMDAFFASVEIRDDPSLRGKPVVVGGGTRGVVAAASYEARRYGVRSAMAMTHALRLCPRAVVVPPNRAAYSAASRQVMDLLREITPLVQPISIDEAFLDVGSVRRTQGRPVEIARRIRERVQEQLALSCSVGIASTKFVAKVASARCKPDGLLVVPVDAVLDFLHPLPVTALWGVGARTAEPLRRLGVRTVGELARTPADTLARAVGPTAAIHLRQLANGVDPRPVTTDDTEKSISAEHTVETDLTSAEEVRRLLLRLADEVAGRVRARGYLARTVGIKIRFADFTTLTRVRTLPNATDTTPAMFETAAALYAALALDRPRIRLVGVKCENLVPVGEVAEQLSFEDVAAMSSTASAPNPRGRLEAVADAARVRFGSAALGYASLLRRDGDPTEPDRMPVPDDGGGDR